MNRIKHTPNRTDKYSNTERSLFFINAISPKTKAMIPAGNVIPTVISHHVSSKFSIPNPFTRVIETAMITIKTAFTPTDHFPRMVFGTMFFVLFI